MPQPISLARLFTGGLNRGVGVHALDDTSSPDTTDGRIYGKKVGSFGPRLGRTRISTSTNPILGLGMLAAPFGRYKITATNDGTWLAEAVAWAGVTPGTPLINVTNLALTSNVVTLTSVRHGFTVGQTITVALASGPSGYADVNGSYVIASVATDTFTYALTHANIGSAAATGTVTSGAVFGMNGTFQVRFIQYRNRVYAYNGRDRMRVFDGNRWRLAGIVGGIDYPQITPTVSYGGGTSFNVITAAHNGTTTATLTTASAHGLSVGQYITVDINDNDFDGSFAVATTPSATTLTVEFSHASVTAKTVTGTITTPSSSGIVVDTMAQSGTTVTIVTTTSHNLVTGAMVYFATTITTNGSSGFIGEPYFPTTPVAITVTNATTFTFTAISSATIPTSDFDGSYWTSSGGHSGIVVKAGGAATTITGTYYYCIVAANSNHVDPTGRMKEGIPSAASVAASPTDQSVIVGSIPATHDDPQVDRWNIYRTTNGGYDSGVSNEQNDFFYLGYVPIGTTTYTDTTNDSTGWYLSATNFKRMRFNANIPVTTEIAAIFGNRLFTARFTPISSSTVTVTNNSTTVTLASGPWPDGVRGAWFRKNGDDKAYRIAARPTATTITLVSAYEGLTAAGASYSIYRDKGEVYFSEMHTPESFGPDTEGLRNKRLIPGEQDITGLMPFSDHLLVFTVNQIWVIEGKGVNAWDVRLRPEPYSHDLGAVSQDSIVRVDNEVHFMSLSGPARMTTGEPELYGIQLNTDWLTSLTSIETDLACAGTDGDNIWYSVPSAAGQTMNSKTYRYDREFNAWSEETEVCPLRYVRQDGTSRQLDMLFYIQGVSIFRPNYGTVDGVSAALSGTATSGGSTALVDSGAAFPTTNGGLVECWVRIYTSAGVLRATRRIISNTSTQVNWSSDATLPGSGTSVATNIGDTYEIGNVVWRWETRTFEIPGRKNHVFAGHITMDVVDSTKSVLKRDIVDGTVTPAVSAAPHTYTASERAIKTEANRANRDYAMRLESRNGAIIRHCEIDGVQENDTQ
jgi:hypothetical protein